MAEIIANWIKQGVINFKTGEPFKLEDVKDEVVKAQVQALLDA